MEYVCPDPAKIQIVNQHTYYDRYIFIKILFSLKHYKVKRSMLNISLMIQYKALKGKSRINKEFPLISRGLYLQVVNWKMDTP